MDSSAPNQSQQTKLAEILGPDGSHFETLISHLMSSSNDERSQAEFLFNLCKQTDPASLTRKLVCLLRASPKTEARAKSATLLRKLLTRGDSYIWPCLCPVRQSSIRLHLLASVQDEKDKSITKEICYTVSELASDILPENGWPLLLPFVFECVSSDSPRWQESAFLIISQLSQLSQYSGASLVPYIEDFHAVVCYYMANSSNPDVRVAALSAAISLIKYLPSSDEMDRALLPYMMNTLKELLNLGQEASAREALELLTKFADAEPRFLTRQQLDALEIAKAEGNLADELSLITLEEARKRALGND